MGNLGWATTSFNPVLVVSLDCELVLQLVKGSSGSPNALLSMVHVVSFLGRQGCELGHGFKPILCKLLKVHARYLDAILQQQIQMGTLEPGGFYPVLPLPPAFPAQ